MRLQAEKWKHALIQGWCALMLCPDLAKNDAVQRHRQRSSKAIERPFAFQLAAKLMCGSHVS